MTKETEQLVAALLVKKISSLIPIDPKIEFECPLIRRPLPGRENQLTGSYRSTGIKRNTRKVGFAQSGVVLAKCFAKRPVDDYAKAAFLLRMRRQQDHGPTKIRIHHRRMRKQQRARHRRHGFVFRLTIVPHETHGTVKVARSRRRSREIARRQLSRFDNRCDI